MTDRETRLRVTVTQLSSMVEALEHLHETVLPQNPRRYWLESQAPLEVISQLTKELRDLLGLKLDGHRPSSGEPSSPPAVIEQLPGVEVPPTSVAGKE